MDFLTEWFFSKNTTVFIFATKLERIYLNSHINENYLKTWNGKQNI